MKKIMQVFVFYERHGFKKIGIKHFPLGKQDRICPILEKEI